MAVGMLCIDGSPAAGSTFNLILEDPDLGASLTASYEPSSGSTGTFSVTGWPTEFTLSGTNSPTIGGNSSYNLTALINKSTGDSVSGSLAIDGTIPSLGVSSGTLLTGTLSQFGYQDSGGDIFEFVFNVKGGDLAHYYTTNQIGITLHGNWFRLHGQLPDALRDRRLAGSFGQFRLPSVPEPSAGVLLLGVLGCVLPALREQGRFRRGGSCS